MVARSRILMFAAALALLGAESAWAVGRFMYVDGNVSVRNATGVARLVRAGDEINELETVLVGEGRAQLRFDDGGWIALQPRTVFEVKEHKSNADGNTIFALIKGSARAVTGLLADRRPQRYRMETPMATIGIRGTSFQVTVCVQSCNTPDGLYVTGGDGTAFVRNGFGEVDVSRGRTAYVANAQTPPRESNVKPAAEVVQTVTAQTVAAASNTTPGELLPGNLLYSSGTGGYVGPFEIMDVTSFGLAGAVTGKVTGKASGLVEGIFKSAESSVSGAGFGASAEKTMPGESITVVLDGLQRPFSVTLTGQDGGRISATALNVPEIAQNDGILYWGRWKDATFNFDIHDPVRPATANGSATVAGYIHYLVGVPAASIPTSGSATYSFIGGSGTTSAAGTVGPGVTAGSLTANFLANTVGANLTVSHDGIYTASGSANMVANNRASFVSTSGSASGPAGTVGFKFDGFFAGSGAAVPPRAGIAFTIQRPDAIVGTAGFKCATGC